MEMIHVKHVNITKLVVIILCINTAHIINANSYDNHICSHGQHKTILLSLAWSNVIKM